MNPYMIQVSDVMYLVVRAIPELKSQQVHSQSSIARTHKPAQLANVIYKIFLGIFKTKHF